MAKYNQTRNFKFVGFVSFKEDNLVKSKDGSSWRMLNFSVTDGNNTQYVQSSEFGAGNTFRVKVLNNDGGYEDREVQWYERDDDELLKEVAGFSKKYVLGRTVLHQHDFNEEILKAVKDGRLRSCKYEDGKVVDGVKVSVSGQIKLNYYNGNVSQQYEITRFNIVKDETPCEFTGRISLVFTKGAVKDDARNKRLVLNGFMQEYNKSLFGEKTPNGLLQQMFVLNYEEVKNGSSLKKYLESKMVADKGEYKAICLDVNFVRGAKEVTVEEFKPTKEQEELIELGLMTLEEVMEANKPVGKKVNEVQVQKINIGGNYAKVLVKTDFTDKNVYKEETEEDMFENDSIFSSDNNDDESPFDVDDLPF